MLHVGDLEHSKQHAFEEFALNLTRPSGFTCIYTWLFIGYGHKPVLCTDMTIKRDDQANMACRRPIVCVTAISDDWLGVHHI